MRHSRKTLKTTTSNDMNKRNITYEKLDDIQTHDLKKRKIAATLDQQQQERYDFQGSHTKALSLDMNKMHSMGEAIGSALDKQNEKIMLSLEPSD